MFVKSLVNLNFFFYSCSYATSASLHRAGELSALEVCSDQVIRTEDLPCLLFLHSVLNYTAACKRRQEKKEKEKLKNSEAERKTDASLATRAIFRKTQKKPKIKLKSFVFILRHLAPIYEK